MHIGCLDKHVYGRLFNSKESHTDPYERMISSAMLNVRVLGVCCKSFGRADNFAFIGTKITGNGRCVGEMD